MLARKTHRAACVCGRGTVGLVASAPLAGRDGGFDLGDVLAAASPRGLTAILASNWTAHDVFLSAGGDGDGGSVVCHLGVYPLGYLLVTIPMGVFARKVVTSGL